MTTHVRTIIIGAGQAGLALSRELTEAGEDHLVLERGRPAERWRSERWDSFRLLSPSWQTRLPHYRYGGPDPDGFMTGTEVVAFFDGYVRSFAPPLLTGVEVTAVEPATRGWEVRTAAGERWSAENVVVATGHYDGPSVPSLARSVPRGVHQLHTSRYRNPAALPDGAVLVVGAGPSGQQIADELALAGRDVYLAVGHHRPLPRRYRGQDAFWWMDRIGLLTRTIDTLPDPSVTRNAPSVVLSGEPRDLDLRRLAADGVVPVGRLVGAEDGWVTFADDLPDRLAEADHNVRRLRAAVDDYVGRTATPAPPPEDDAAGPAPWAAAAPRRLHLGRAGVRTVVWATGHRRDYSWLRAPVLDGDGEPVQHRGVTPAPGLYFLGLRWMYRRNSSFIDGVGADARFLASRLVPARTAVPVG